MINEMSIDNFYELSKTISKHLSLNELKTKAREFAQTNQLSFEESMCIVFIAFDICVTDSFKSFATTRRMRIKELNSFLKSKK